MNRFFLFWVSFPPFLAMFHRNLARKERNSISNFCEWIAQTHLLLQANVIKTKQDKNSCMAREPKITENPLLICECHSKNSRTLAFSCMAKMQSSAIKKQSQWNCNMCEILNFISLWIFSLWRNTVKGLNCDIHTNDLSSKFMFAWLSIIRLLLMLFYLVTRIYTKITLCERPDITCLFNFRGGGGSEDVPL